MAESSTNNTPWRHDADHIRRLQLAHADYIESTYRGLMVKPGNPDGVCIETFGEARTFIAKGPRFTNRAVFTGNETAETVNAVFAHFDANGAACVIEVNPANFYPGPPFVWRSNLMPLLLERGCEPRHFRCVWHTEAKAKPTLPETDLCIVRYTHAEMAEFLPLARIIEEPENPEEMETLLRDGEGSAEWLHYVAFAGEKPAATASLFLNNRIGYLASAHTHPEYRRRGAHSLLIATRLHDTFTNGGMGVFSVTNSHTQSGLDLQRMGLTLAYNQQLLIRPPTKE